MKISGTFPEWYRAFTHEETALCMGRDGGISELALIDVEKVHGVPYPDNASLRLMSREGLSCGKPLFGAGLRFLNVNRNQAVDYFYPKDTEVHPWGFESRSFDMFLDRHRVFFTCRSADPARKIFRGCFNSEYLVKHPQRTMKSERTAELEAANAKACGMSLEPVELTNGKVTLQWGEPVIQKKSICFPLTLEYPYGARFLVLCIMGDGALKVIRTGSCFFLDLPWEKQTERSFVMTFAKTEGEALQMAESGLKNRRQIFNDKRKQKRYIEKHTAAISIEGLPEASEFLQEQNQYLHAFLVAEKSGTRAASFKYAFWAMWDGIYPIRDFLRNGEYQQAVRMYRYLLHYPNMSFFMRSTFHLVIMLEEILAYRRDAALLKEAYPVLERFMQVAARLTDKETGLVAGLANCGVDFLEEQGISGRHYAVCINGFYYNALRIMENLAADTGWDPLPYRTIRQKMEKSYPAKFYVPEAGYLRLVLKNDLTPAPVTVFQNTSTIGLDFPFGARLLNPHIPQIAGFQAAKLRHPLGHTAVPHDSPLPCEMWKNVHMNQHLGHEAKLARLGGHPEEAFRIMQGYLSEYRKYRVAVETFNLAGYDGDSSQKANWQSFSSTGAVTGLISGVAGIQHHGGGYSYFPADDSREIRISRLPFRGKLLNIHIHGKGCYANSYFNGKKLKGTLQLPQDLVLNLVNEWEIIRTNRRPVSPILIYTAGMPVSQVTCSAGKLSFTCERSGAFPMEIAGGGEPVKMFINGKEFRLKPFDPVIHKNDRIEFRSGSQEN